MVERIVFQADPTPPVTPPVVVAPAGDRPAWLPENFGKPEDMVTSYKELQAKVTELSKPAVVVPPVVAQTPEEKAAADAKAVADAAALAAMTPEQKAAADAAALAEANAKLATAGIDYAGLETKFMAAGKLDDADFAALEKAGIPRAVAEQHIKDRVSAGERVHTETMALAGGEAQFAKMADWVRGNYTPEQLASYNQAIDSGEVGRMQLAVKAVKADYDKVHGVMPNLLVPKGGPVVTGSAYASMAQFLADVNTTLYRNDPAERARVELKLKNSKI